MKTILKLMIIAIAFHSSFANAVTGNEYRQMDYTHQVVYISGVFDTYSGPPACIPEQVSVNQIVAIFNKYLNSHPEEWHFMASGLVYLSIFDAFPCKTEDKKTK